MIRLAREAEFPTVSALTVAAYATAYAIESDSRYLVELGQVAERAKTQQVWVALDEGNGAVLGTVSTPLPGQHLSPYAGERDMDFRMLATGVAARGLGVGRALVARCEQVARDRGATRLVLHTGEEMDLAIALYERLGFDRLRDIENNFPYPPGVWFAVRVYGKELSRCDG